MSTVPFSDIVGPTYTLASVNADCQRCVNMLLERISSGKGQNEFYLKETPGLDPFIDFRPIFQDFGFSFTDQNIYIQAMRVCANGRVFVVVCHRLFEIFSNKAVIFRGDLAGSNTIVSDASSFKFKLSENSNLLVIIVEFTSLLTGDVTTTGLASLTFSDNTLHEIYYARTGFLGGKFIDFMDQYFITTVIDSTNPSKLTTQFQISPLNVTGEQAWSALDVFSVESSPDLLNGLIVNGREVWLFGLNSYEVWFDTGDLLRPFQRIRDAAYAIGCIAPNTIQTLEKNVFWLGSSKDGYGIVWMSQGYQAIRISSIAIEFSIKGFVDITDAFSWTYQTAGQSVYVVNFPTAKRTFAYNLITEQWHELSYRDPITGVNSEYRVGYQIFAFNKNIVGDFKSGQLYELSTTVYTDNLAPIVRYRRSPAIFEGQKWIFYNSLILNIEAGVGLNNGDDPKIFIRWSNDNGHTWGNYHNRSIGKIGEYSLLITFSKLGMSKKARVFEVYLSDPVPFRIITAELDVALGAH